MKHIKSFLLSLLLLGEAFASNAQVTGRYTYNSPNVYMTTLDTVTNTGADTFTAKVAGKYQSVSLQMNATKVTGTPLGTIVTWQASCDPGTAVNYQTLSVDSVKTVTPTQVFIHTFVGNPYTSYRAIVTGFGTQTSSYQSTALVR